MGAQHYRKNTENVKSTANIVKIQKRVAFLENKCFFLRFRTVCFTKMSVVDGLVVIFVHSFSIQTLQQSLTIMVLQNISLFHCITGRLLHYWLDYVQKGQRYYIPSGIITGCNATFSIVSKHTEKLRALLKELNVRIYN